MLKGDHVVDPPKITQSCDPPAVPAGAIPGADSTIPTPRVAEEQVSSVTNKDMKTERFDSYKPGQKPGVAAYQGGLQDVKYLSPIARLGLQCQMRHFNPEWHATSGPNGFTYSVRIIDKIFYGDHAYNTAEEAKHHVAKKALTYVCGLPCEDPAEKPAEKLHTTRHWGTPSRDRYPSWRHERGYNATVSAGHTNYHGQRTHAAPMAANTATYDRRAQNHDEYNEQGTIIRRIKSVLGGTGLGPSVLSDPLASQAFLQGLAVGTASVRAAGPAYDPPHELRRRSFPIVGGDVYRPDRYMTRERSPAPNPGHDYMARERYPVPSPSRNYRERSPMPNTSRNYMARERSPVPKPSRNYRERSPVRDASRGPQARFFPYQSRRDRTTQRSPPEDVVARKN